jgi:hypothetical protein
MRHYGWRATRPRAKGEASASSRQHVRTRTLYRVDGLRREMAKLANGASLDLLAYLLSLVVLEAESLNASELVAGPDDSPLQRLSDRVIPFT